MITGLHKDSLADEILERTDCVGEVLVAATESPMSQQQNMTYLQKIGQYIRYYSDNVSLLRKIVERLTTVAHAKPLLRPAMVEHGVLERVLATTLKQPDEQVLFLVNLLDADVSTENWFPWRVALALEQGTAGNEDWINAAVYAIMTVNAAGIRVLIVHIAEATIIKKRIGMLAAALILNLMTRPLMVQYASVIQAI